jgi:hypothetical protein
MKWEGRRRIALDFSSSPAIINKDQIREMEKENNFIDGI